MRTVRGLFLPKIKKGANIYAKEKTAADHRGMEQAQNLRETQPTHDECKQIRWKGKREKFAEAHRADLAIWDAANRYLRANLPDMKLTPKAWQTELAALTAENEAEYARLKAQREEVTELQKVRRYVDVALKADAPQKAKNKHHDIDR